MQVSTICVALVAVLLMVGCTPTRPEAPLTTAIALPTPTVVPTLAATPTIPPVSPIPTPTNLVPEGILGSGLPLSEISYRLPLTLRHVTKTTAVIFFELDTPAPGSLYLYSPGAVERTGQRIPLNGTQTRHLITVEGLQPATSYEVMVALESADDPLEQPGFLSEAWGPVRFQTIAEAGPLRIGVIGDASFGDPVTTALIEQMAGADLDFVLHTGDVVDETEHNVDPFQSYAEKFYTPFTPLLTQMPVYTVIGNHDYDRDIRWQEEPFYYHAFPPFADPSFPDQEAGERIQYYGFVHRGVQFLMLDSQVFFGPSGREEQAAWLAERLDAPGFRMTIPVFHVAPFSSSAVHPQNSLPVREVWVPLFEQASVPLVLSGHFHQYERLANNGVTYIVASGGSSILYASEERLPQSQVLRRQSHFVLLEIANSEIHITAIALEGEVIDRVSLPIP